MKIAAFDVETSGELPEYALQPWRVRQGKAWLTSLAWVWRQDGRTMHDGGLSPDLGMIRRMLAWAHETGHILVGWNVLFDLAWLYAYADDEIIKLLGTGEISGCDAALAASGYRAGVRSQTSSAAIA